LWKQLRITNETKKAFLSLHLQSSFQQIFKETLSREMPLTLNNKTKEQEEEEEATLNNN